MSTKDVILQKAIKLFNEHGLEYVGVRELAKELNIKAGNITYYFPTKNHLVSEIANRCTLANTGILDIKEGMSSREALFMLQKLFMNQYKYRSLLISLPHIIREIEEINRNYKSSQVLRKESFIRILDVLQRSGSINEVSESTRNCFVDLLIMTQRFGISDYTISESIQYTGNSPYRHIVMISDFLALISTPKGLEEIALFKEEVEQKKRECQKNVKAEESK